MTSAPVETDDELLFACKAATRRRLLRSTAGGRRPSIPLRTAHERFGSLWPRTSPRRFFWPCCARIADTIRSRGTLSGYLFGIARKLVLRHLERGRSDVALDDGFRRFRLAGIGRTGRSAGWISLAAKASTPCAGPFRRCRGATGKWWSFAIWRKWITPMPRWCWAARSARCVPGCIGRAGCCWKSCTRNGIPGTLLGA